MQSNQQRGCCFKAIYHRSISIYDVHFKWDLFRVLSDAVGVLHYGLSSFRWFEKLIIFFNVLVCNENDAISNLYKTNTVKSI